MRSARTASIIVAALATASCIAAQTTDNAGEPPVIAHPVPPPPAPEFNNERILGVIPNFQTVNDPNAVVLPLTVRQKFVLFVKESADPFTFAGAALGAAISFADNDDPKYGQGMKAYGERFGAAVADIATQNFFGDFVLASLLHEDPRYFRMGSEHRFLSRVGYSLSRIMVTRTDRGGERFNYSGVLGMVMGIGLSDAYYPAKSVNAPEFGSRVVTSLLSAAMGNLLPEFWPDVQRKVLHRHRQSATGTPTP